MKLFKLISIPILCFSWLFQGCEKDKNKNNADESSEVTDSQDQSSSESESDDWSVWGG